MTERDTNPLDCYSYHELDFMDPGEIMDTLVTWELWYPTMMGSVTPQELHQTFGTGWSEGTTLEAGIPIEEETIRRILDQCQVLEWAVSIRMDRNGQFSVAVSRKPSDSVIHYSGQTIDYALCKAIIQSGKRALQQAK